MLNFGEIFISEAKLYGAIATILTAAVPVWFHAKNPYGTRDPCHQP